MAIGSCVGPEPSAMAVELEDLDREPRAVFPIGVPIRQDLGSCDEVKRRRSGIIMGRTYAPRPRSSRAWVVVPAAAESGG